MNVTLEQLADHLEKGERLHEHFSFAAFNNGPPNGRLPGCGTHGCAIGELPALDPRFSFSGLAVQFRGELFDATMAADYFGIGHGAALHLFYPGNQVPSLYGGKVLDETATAADVASNIREFIKKQKNGKVQD